MTDYYVRPGGSDSNAGTGPGTGDAWLTIGKALGAAGISSGDTVYVAPGTYRETVGVGMTSAVAETFVIGDVAAAQFTDLDGGPVVLTAYTTDDKTAPSASPTVSLNARDYLTFQDFLIVGGSNAGALCLSITTGSTNLTFRRCVFLGPAVATVVLIQASADTALDMLFDSCVFLGAACMNINPVPTSASSDYDLDLQIHNCLFLGTAASAVLVVPSGAGSFKGGGVDIFNSVFLGKAIALNANGANLSTTIPCTVYNSFMQTSSAALTANTSGQIVEDYNLIVAATPRTNVSAGGSSVAGNPPAYAPLMELGYSGMVGMRPRPFFAPTLGSPMLGFGNQAGGPSLDALGLPRPLGPARTWANILSAIGAFERGNTATRETTTVRAGSNAVKLLGPSCQDFELAVDAASTTVSVYGRYDSAYGAGTKPRLQVLANAKIGVSAATDTITGAADTWEQLSLTFTPTAAGIVTVRLLSDGDGDGAAFFDDFDVT